MILTAKCRGYFMSIKLPVFKKNSAQILQFTTSLSDDQGKKELTDVQLISPARQNHWGWPAVANFFLGGAGTGFYLLSILATILTGGASAVSKPIVFGLLAPLLIGIGFLVLTIEAGRPLRGRYLFRQVWHAWISRETLACAIFVPAVILDQLFPHLIFRLVAVVAALGLMISQGFIVYCARAVTAWNVPIMPLLFLSSGFASGGGLVLLVAAFGWLPFGQGLAVVALICVVLSLVVWVLYLRWSRSVAFQLATKDLRRPIALIVSVGLGHIVPLLLLLIVIGVSAGREFQVPHIVGGLSGLAMIVGGLSQKAGIIMDAGYTREITLRY